MCGTTSRQTPTHGAPSLGERGGGEGESVGENKKTRARERESESESEGESARECLSERSRESERESLSQRARKGERDCLSEREGIVCDRGGAGNPPPAVMEARTPLSPQIYHQSLSAQRHLLHQCCTITSKNQSLQITSNSSNFRCPKAIK